MTRQYEIVYIFDAALDEAQVNERLDRFHQLLRSADGGDPVTKSNHWGKRTLAYPIKSKEQGYFVVTHLEADPALLGEFERALKLDEAMLRHLIVINDGLVPDPAAVAEAPESDAEEPAAAPQGEGA